MLTESIKTDILNGQVGEPNRRVLAPRTLRERNGVVIRKKSIDIEIRSTLSVIDKDTKLTRSVTSPSFAYLTLSVLMDPVTTIPRANTNW